MSEIQHERLYFRPVLDRMRDVFSVWITRPVICGLQGDANAICDFGSRYGEPGPAARDVNSI